jgi:peptide/nickel transport system permease protein
LGYLPLTTDPWGALRATALPALTLGVALAAPLTRFLRSGMLDVLALDYVRTARAKGLPEGRVIARHALKNALLSVVTVLGLQIGALLGGSIVIEQVFAWPGIGRLSLAAIQQRDYGVVQGIVLFVATGFVLVNFLVDLVYLYLDPRIRYESAPSA